MTTDPLKVEDPVEPDPLEVLEELALDNSWRVYEFDVPAIPVAQPRQRHAVRKIKGRVMAVNYTPANDPVQTYKAAVQAVAIAAAFAGPMEGPIELTLAFRLPKNKAAARQNRFWHMQKPDMSNLIKSTEDALNGIVWRDDSQVCSMSAIKTWSDNPGVTIKIESLLRWNAERGVT